MIDSKLTDKQLSQLLTDSLIADGPDPELMVRYAQAPDSLSKNEQQEIEHYISSSPAAADELRVLQSFKSKHHASTPIKNTRVRPSIIRNFLSNLQTWLSDLSAPQWAPAAFAIVLAIPILFQLSKNNEFLFITPHYKTPTGVESPYWLANPVRSAGSLNITVLAPEHIGLTLSSQPVLYWTVNQIPESGDFIFNITDIKNDQHLLSEKIKLTKPGMQRLLLKDFKTQLNPNVVYRWSITYSQANEEIYDVGAIEYIEASTRLQKYVSSANEGEISAIYARHGYWYDMFSKTHQLQKLHPENNELNLALKNLHRPTQ